MGEYRIDWVAGRRGARLGIGDSGRVYVATRLARRERIVPSLAWALRCVSVSGSTYFTAAVSATAAELEAERMERALS